MEKAPIPNSDTGGSSSVVLEDFNRFKGTLTRELFAELEVDKVQNDFKGCLLRNLFLDDQFTNQGEYT